MSVIDPTAGLTREEKRELLRQALLEQMARPRTAPASLAQEGLWFLDRMEGAGAAYNFPVALRLRGALDVAALERALGEIVRRHEALRTTLAEQDGAPVQVIAPVQGFALAVDDVTGAEAMRRVEEDARAPFELSAGPLFRARLLRIAADDHVLLACMHHVVTDGWSLGVFFGELSALYAAFREGRESPLGELPVQYADHATQQRAAQGGEAMARQLAWWRERLTGAPALLELPTDHPRP
ncbi:MAG TPA: condensation domain-containing protein, partial [Longimicrobiaceae bacterium]|nr:condensation domain-containing protein [Longimicrobiaceae bacterium]